ncbi:MAG: hypothetical protein WCG34_11065, partial [Leptolinea sp.]
AFGILLLSGCSIGIPPTPITVGPTLQAETQIPIPSKTPIPLDSIATPKLPLTPTRQTKSYETIDRSNAARLVEITSSHIENIGRMYWLPDAKAIAVLSLRHFLILEPETLAVQKDLPIPEGETLLDFEPIHQLLAVTTDRNSVIVKDMGGKTVQTISQAGGFGSAAFSFSGDSIWLSSMEKFEAAAYAIQTGKRASACGGFETAAPVYAAFQSPGGKWLVWMARATIQLSQIPSCQPAARIGHEDFIISHAFSSDEQTLVTSTEGTLNGEFQPLVFFWDANTGKQKFVFPLVDSSASGLAFSSNAEVLVTAGSGLIVWDVSTKKEIIKLAETDKRFTSVVFSPDGTILVASTEDSIHMYAVKP